MLIPRNYGCLILFENTEKKKGENIRELVKLNSKKRKKWGKK